LDAFTLFFFFRKFASLRLVSRGRFLERESLDVEDSESEEDEDDDDSLDDDDAEEELELSENCSSAGVGDRCGPVS